MRRTWTLAAVAGICLLAGCVSPYQSTARPEVELLQLQTPVTSLAWATGTDQLLGIAEDDRLVKLDRRTGQPIEAVQLASAGENIALLTYPTERAYVAQPEQDTIAVVETNTMRHVRDLPAGESPAWVTAHPTSQTLLALSRNGASVTGVDVETRSVALRVRLSRSPDAEIVEAEDSLTPAFWVVSSGSAIHFGDQPLARGRIRGTYVEPDTFSPNRDKSGSAYASLDDASRIATIELRSGRRTVTAERDVGVTIEQVESRAKEEFRIFAAGEGRLTVLDSDSLSVLATVEYGAALDEASLEGAQVGDVVVGDLYIYLPVEDEPYLLRVRKPSE